jgi:16S rRNA (cytidine1402-2'-O)-methyltransferase
VILVGGAEGVVVEAADWQAALDEALAAGPLRAAVDEITARFGLKRKEVYDAALARKAED